MTTERISSRLPFSFRVSWRRGSTSTAEIRQRATRLWEGVEWSWFLKDPGSKILYWHWSPDLEWKNNVWIAGWNEGMIAYLLAIASPTHPIPAECYYGGWTRPKTYANGNEEWGVCPGQIA